MAEPKLKALTYRVQFIPKGTTPSELIQNYFHAEDQAYLTVKSLCPSVESIEGEDLTATVLFEPPEARPDGPRRQDRKIEVDKDFMGLTPLYVPSVGKDHIAADIIAVTGLAAHAYGSWAHCDDEMWLRDLLKRQAPKARILTYGYSSKLRNGSSSILDDYVESFHNALSSMRDAEQCERRPIIFIGHSLGCLLIKKVLIKSMSSDIPSRLPVRSIVFIAAPHRGLEVTALQALVKGELSQQMISELAPGSATLQELNKGFKKFAYDIDILTLYETMRTKTVALQDGSWERIGNPVMMVEKDSAMLHYPQEKAVPAHENHSDIAKLKRGTPSFTDVGYAIRYALRPPAEIAGKELQSRSSDFVNSANQGAAAYSNTTASSQSVLRLQSQPPNRIPESMSTPLRKTPESLPQQPDAVPSRGPLPAPNSIPTHAADCTGLRISENSPSRENQGIYYGGSQNMLPSLDFPDGREPIHSKASPVRNTSESQPANKATVPERVPTLAPNPTPTPVLEKINLPDSTPALPGAVEDIDGQSQKPPKATRLIDRGIESFKSDDTATNVLAKNRKEAVPGASPCIICQRCSQQIPESNPHYGHGCSFGLHPIKKQSWWCSSCFHEDSSSKYRFSIVNCFGFRHSVLYMDDEISNNDESIVKAIKLDDVKALSLEIWNVRRSPAYDSTTSQSLCLAARLGRTKCAEMLLNAGAPKDLKDEFGNTPLLLAVEYNHLPIVRKLLIDYHVDINICSGGRTALSCAVENGQSDIVDLLLKKKAKIKFDQGPSLLVKSVSKGDDKTAGLLLDAGAEVDLKEKGSGDTALLIAAAEGHDKIVEMLLFRQADVNAINNDKDTPLLKSCKYGRTRTTRLLIGAGAKVSSENSRNRMPLHNAVESGVLEIVDLLLELDAYTEARTDEGRTPLQLAVIKGEEQICQRLLDIRARKNRYESALRLAVLNNHLSIVKMLLKRGADVHLSEGNDNKCLHLAAKSGNLEICEALVNHHAHLDNKIRDYPDYGVTPLHLATKYNHGPIVALLLHRGAKVDSTDSIGYTSLHWAAEQGNFKICQQLLQRDASTNLKSTDEKTPLFLAIMYGNHAIVKLLLEYGADPNQHCRGLSISYEDKDTVPPLYRAAESGDMDSLKFLVEKGARLNERTRWKFNAVSGAAYYGHIEAIKFLLEKGASGAPPPYHRGKWKRQLFSDTLSPETRLEVLKVLREAKHK